MSRAHCLSLLATMVVVLLLLMSLEVEAQSTVDDDDSCQSTTLKEVVNIIRADIKSTNETATTRDIKLMEDMAEVKNLLGSLQQPCQCDAVDSSSLCEYKTRSPLMYMQCRRKDL